MRPKKLHWCVIGWTDNDPEVALCLNVRQLTFYFPNGGGRRDGGIEDIDSTSQVLKVLDKPAVPQIPEKLRHARVKED